MPMETCIMMLSEADKQVLTLLRENARLPVTELARLTGVSRTTVQARIERLEESGVIDGYTVRLGASYTQSQLRAQVMVKLTPKQSRMVEKGLAALPDVTLVYSVSGAFDMIVFIACDGVEELDRTIDAIGALDGVERTESSILLATKLQR